MRKVLLICLATAAMLALMVGTGIAEEKAEKVDKVEKAEHDYVGAKKCKTCHKVQFKSWSETGHAKAFSLLSAEEQKNEECVACHITGALADKTVLENVQCEACHGGGKDYKSIKIMNKKKWKADPETYKKMAIDAGLVYPTEETCVKCHNKNSPNFKEFDFAKRKDLVHPAPKDSI